MRQMTESLTATSVDEADVGDEKAEPTAAPVEEEEEETPGADKGADYQAGSLSVAAQLLI